MQWGVGNQLPLSAAACMWETETLHKSVSVSESLIFWGYSTHKSQNKTLHRLFIGNQNSLRHRLSISTEPNLDFFFPFVNHYFRLRSGNHNQVRYSHMWDSDTVMLSCSYRVMKSLFWLLYRLYSTCVFFPSDCIEDICCRLLCLCAGDTCAAVRSCAVGTSNLQNLTASCLKTSLFNVR